MDLGLKPDDLKLFVVLVLPGLISIKVYRLVMPVEAMDWGNAVLEGLFYSLLNLILCFPLLWLVHRGTFAADHPWLYTLAAVVVLLLLPVVWPLVLVWVRNWACVSRWFQLPYQTAWDFLFAQRPAVFVLIHLKTGEMVGGYFGSHSYATAYPTEGDIYVELVYRVNPDGTFGEPMEGSLGLLVRKDEYTHLELFAPSSEGVE